MSDPKSVIEGGVYIAIVLYVFRTYLILNKLSARRHSQEVCESISVMALLVSYGATSPFVPGQAQPAQWWRASTAWTIPADSAGALDEEDQRRRRGRSAGARPGRGR